MGETSQSRAVKDYRKRLSSRGMGRFEVLGLETDRGLIRQLARRLADEPEGSQVRAAIIGTIEDKPSSVGGIYAALRRSPLVGADLDLSRSDDRSRDVDL